MELEISTQVILLAGFIALILGAVANKTNFCTMGAVSDWVNMNSKERMRAWFLAIATALGGVLVLEVMGIIDLNQSRIPYRSSTFAWPRYLLGGLMFGVGMTLCSGCGNKNLIRIGGGNVKSILVVIVAAVFAYLMTKTDFYGVVFHSWMNPLSINMASAGIESQELGTMLGGVVGFSDPVMVNRVISGLLTVLILIWVFASSDFRGSFNNILGGLVVGMAVLGGWYISGGPMGLAWVEAVEFMDTPPPSVGVQSYTFINPMGETLTWMMAPANTSLITFGVAALLGVIAGSFLYSIATGRFRIEWFTSISDFINHMVGAVLIGIGGVLGLGCTVGQGVTGVSTLALGSFITLGSIIIGSALTMKVQLYKMVYEDEASFSAALITAMADLHLLPNSMRRLEAV